MTSIIHNSNHPSNYHYHTSYHHHHQPSHHNDHLSHHHQHHHHPMFFRCFPSCPSVPPSEGRRFSRMASSSSSSSPPSPGGNKDPANSIVFDHSSHCCDSLTLASIACVVVLFIHSHHDSDDLPVICMYITDERNDNTCKRCYN